MTSSSLPSVSIVVPVMNEEQTITRLAEEVVAVADAQDGFRLVDLHFIDDGSNDATWERICEAAGADLRVRGIRLRRNFGKATALQIGAEAAAGDIIVTMDGDLQDDPRELPRFVAAVLAGDDVVSGWKRTRHDPLGKTLPSKVFNAITAWASSIPLHDFNCGYKAYRREVFEAVHLYGELHRFVPVLAHACGFRIGEIEVTHHPRRFGHSKYGARRFLRGLLDLFTVMTVTRYARKPGHLFGAGGLVLGALGTLVLAWLSVQWLLGHAIGERPLLQLGVLLVLVGMQLLMFGLLAELMISRDRDSPSAALVRERCGERLSSTTRNDAPERALRQ
ncbi:glycosyltransferase family 2 protein [Dokdonella sp.]|uniref:glycosyltransferase family 2 protein n=1 Tax=Dokdonella sp. TaxID=2291710 RepID=UPI001B1B964F|nr:glycosyltransferase family 2 protein [Dokdonella sp.]MBO9665166.1 glycosyltransferase family 2 protein [Dokdonella sp.]